MAAGRLHSTYLSPAGSLASPEQAAQSRVAAFPVESMTCDLSEREAVGLHAGVEEFDFERSILDLARLADQLISPLLASRPLAMGIDVASVHRGSHFAVDEDAKSHRVALSSTSHHQVDVAGMKAERDAAPRLDKLGGSVRDGPVAGQRPVVEPQPGRRGISVGGVRHDTAR